MARRTSWWLGAALIVAACGDDTTATTAATTAAGGSSSSAGGSASSSSESSSSAGAQGGGGMADPAPGAVTDFAATVDGTDYDLSWSNPSDTDLAGVLVVAGAGVAVDYDPADGTSHTVGENVGTGQTVVFTSLAEAATVPSPAPGTTSFAAWAFDDAGQFSPVALTQGTSNALGEQLGEIEIALDGTVTVVQQPANFTLSGTATYDDVADSIALQLDAENDTARVVFNLKTVVTATNQGDVVGPTFPPGDGDGYGFHGLAIDTGAAGSATIGLDEILGDVDPVVLSVSLVDGAVLFSQSTSGGTGTESLHAYDASGSVELTLIDSMVPGASYQSVRYGVVAPDARRVYFGHKSFPSVIAVDPFTESTVNSTDLSVGDIGLGNVGQLAMSPDGTLLYALVTSGAHWWGGDATDGGVGTSTVRLITLDPGDLTIVDTLTLLTDDGDGASGTGLVVSADGSRAAIAIARRNDVPGSLFFVDLAGMTILDTDAVTSGVQPLTLASPHPRSLAQAADGTLAVSYWSRGGGEPSAGAIDFVDPVSFDVTPLTLTESTAIQHSLAWRGDKLYVAAKQDSLASDVAALVIDSAMTETVLDTGLVFATGDSRSGGKAVGVSGDGSLVYFVVQDPSAGGAAIAVFDAANDTRLDMDGDATNGVTNIGAGGVNGGHTLVVTPF